jgi:hypothetical protein
MRRPGKRKGLRSSQTIRAITCGFAFSSSFPCYNHCREGLNAAWCYHTEAGGNRRTSRKEQLEAVISLYELKGPFRNRAFNCGIERLAQRRYRNYSYEDDLKPERRREMRREVELQLLEG